MAHWLIKSEPAAWSWRDQTGVESEAWTGVRNHQAAANLKAMRRGDTAFFYHSVEQRAVVGVVEIVREAYPDPTDPGSRWVAVDVKAMRSLPHPVGLAEIKADPRLAELPLVRQSRLSVMPIDSAAWDLILALGNAT